MAASLYLLQETVVSWSLTSPFTTNTAISETKGQGWRVIITQWRKASDIVTSTRPPFCLAATQKGTGSRGSLWPPYG